MTCFARDEMVRYGRPGMVGHGTVRYGLSRLGMEGGGASAYPLFFWEGTVFGREQ